MATTFDSRYPFQITVPDSAISYENGEAIVTLLAVGYDVADIDLSNVDPATGRAALDVPAVADVADVALSNVDPATGRAALGVPATADVADDELSNVDPATGRTALGVSATTAVDLKADTHPLPTARVDLIDTNTGAVVRMIPLFAGTLVTAGLVIDGATTAAGACSVAITIDGVPVVLAATLTITSGRPAGEKVTTTVSSGGGFTANQVIEYTTTSANTAATFGTVSLGATRA